MGCHQIKLDSDSRSSTSSQRSDKLHGDAYTNIHIHIIHILETVDILLYSIKEESSINLIFLEQHSENN